MADGERPDLRARLAAVAPEVDEDGGWRAVRQRRERDRRRRRTLALAGVLTAGGLAAGLVAAVGPGDRAGQVVTEPGPVDRPGPVGDPGPLPGGDGEAGWRLLAELPIRGDPYTKPWPVLVWTGQEVLGWAGSARFAYDPTTGTVRELAPPPFAPRPPGAVVWTGAELVVWGASAADPRLFGDRDPLAEEGRQGAAYDPATDTWRPLAPAPISTRPPLAVVWTGEQVIVWGDLTRGGPADRSVQGAAYDPATDTWRRIADAPVGLNHGHGVWTGNHLVVVASALDRDNTVLADVHGMRYDPAADAWTVDPEPPLWPQAPWAVWDGTHLYAGNTPANAVVLDAAGGRWVELPPPPEGLVDCPQSAPATGPGVVVVHCHQLAGFDPTTGAWTLLELPSGTIGTPMSVPGAVLVVTEAGLAAAPGP